MPKPPRPNQSWSPRSGLPMPAWWVGGFRIQAPTASEARARWKQIHRQSRVPVGLSPVREKEVSTP